MICLSLNYFEKLSVLLVEFNILYIDMQRNTIIKSRYIYTPLLTYYNTYPFWGPFLGYVNEYSSILRLIYWKWQMNWKERWCGKPQIEKKVGKKADNPRLKREFICDVTKLTLIRHVKHKVVKPIDIRIHIGIQRKYFCIPKQALDLSLFAKLTNDLN